MATCIACKGEYDVTTHRCSRCGEDNSAWETERSRSGLSAARQFFLSGAWGVLALTSLTLPILAILPLDFQPIASTRIGVPLGILLCFVVFLFTYALRFTTREYELLRQVREGRRLSLAFMALLAFTLALTMALAVAFTLEAHEGPSPTTGLVRVALTLAFSLIFVNVTLSAMLMSIRDFARRLNDLVPQSIFLQEDRLVEVILKSTQKKTGVETGLYVVEMNRMGSGGVRVLVRRSEQPAQPAAGEARKKEAQPSAADKELWEIEANEWGQILSLKLAR